MDDLVKLFVRIRLVMSDGYFSDCNLAKKLLTDLNRKKS